MNKNKNKKYTIIILMAFLFFVGSSTNIVFAEIYSDWGFESASPAGIGGSIVTRDPGTLKINIKNTIQDWAIYLKNHSWDVLQKAWKTAGSKALSSAISSALNTIAYDTATWLGSGGKGQKPMFITEGWGEYLTNVADNAAGTFVEQLGKNGPVAFNLCKPDFAVNLKIGLGLINYGKPQKPACTFSEMKKNWEKELRDPNFLGRFQDMFNPASNDLGIALSLQTGMMQNIELVNEKAKLERSTNKSWLDITGIDGRISNIPGIGEQAAELIQTMQTAPLLRDYQDEFVQAANIFLNQLAVTLINEKLRKLGGKASTAPYDWSKLSNQFAGPSNDGIAGAKEQLKKIIEPKFNVRGDYNILGELTQCPNPTKAGPTNCVIDDKFRQAVENKSTVGEALKNGSLKVNGIFGYNSNGLEPNYLEGYPYRSMIILRKFRIIPVGWEIAAEYIAKNPEITKTKNLEDLVACFSSNDEYDNGYDEAWCKGLVDPSWVLKAPLNYCRREGPGPEIISSTVSGSGNDSSLNISRNDKYCADEQSCIKENDDGSCQIYGYCTEERRRWRFDSRACEPKYNTCETFKADTGGTISYLENSLNYSGCSVDNAGCKGYCTDLNYTTGNYTCTTAGGNKLFFDKGAEACNAKNEGCHEFVRAKTGLGANLLQNSSFEDALTVGGWNALSGNVSATSYDGVNSFNLQGSSQKTVFVAPVGYNIGAVNGDVFTLSFYSNGCGGGTFKVDGTQPELFNMATSSGWQLNQATYVVPEAILGRQLILNLNGGGGCLIDALKLERGYKATAFNDYQSNDKVYEKLLPDYLQSECYDGGGNLKPTAPAECSGFARTCIQDEVGCEMFTAKEDRMSVPAKVGAQNYCIPECVGFKSYLATETFFEPARQENFIPKTAKSCSAAAVGCDEFTNLDKAALGGEAVEYYSYLRQCVKPGGSCSEFYTWEGSSESGFQLRVISLDAVGSAEPRVTEDDSALCNNLIYNLAPTDPAYNSDCREFYNSSGLKFYHLYSRTVSCDENCHPYRRTEVETGSTDCKNGGSWSAEHNACIYNVIPDQGRICPAAAAGCREYTGSSGRNIRVVLNNDFEDGTMQNWTGASLSNESILAGGHSLSVNSRINKNIVSIAQAEKSYIVSFIAKTAGATSLEVRFENGAAAVSSFGSVTGVNGNWQIYELNLARISHQLDAGEKLSIIGNGAFFIDNIKLTEVVNRYYLIKNSWNTPAVCNADLAGKPMPNYMLGCEEYTDRDRQTHYLRSFAYLCSESAVGCELLLDSRNSANPAAESFNAGAPAGDEVDIPADDYIYAVYDKTKKCNQADKGCQRLGLPYEYAGEVIYGDTYLKNDPDKYASAMCTIDGANCGEYSTATGLSYFKNPGDQLCEWRQTPTDWSWYKKKINRCDTNNDGEGEGGICLKDSNCLSGQKCLLDNRDITCPVNDYKTFGLGSNVITQPDVDAANNYWTGLCPADAAGCSEVIDPISGFSANLVFNSDFSQHASGGIDGWSGNQQQVKVEPNTLYRLAGQDGTAGNSLSITCNSPIFLLDPTFNSLSPAGPTINLANLAVQNKSRIWYSAEGSSCRLNLGAIHVGSTNIELKKVVLDYQLKQNLKKTECNGAVKPEEGCVLFNLRTQNGGTPADLIYDADTSPTAPNSGAPDAENDANVLLKVEPDRACNKWLACKTKVAITNESSKEENLCLDIGTCNSLDENGNCNSFVRPDKINQTYPLPISAGAASNYSGYSKIGLAPNDDFPLGEMKQVGESTQINNGSFEIAGSNGYPISWSARGTNIVWDENVFKVISNPYTAQKEGVGNAPDGKSFMKLGAAYSIESESIDVSPQKLYVVTASANTLNLSSGAAKLEIYQYTDDNTLLPGVEETSLVAGKNWEIITKQFTSNAQASRLKIVLSAPGGSIGNAYFDDIKIAAVLNSRNNWYVPQSCRLYPQDDALSCDYLDDSGTRQKGWSGYCLEYDSYPGSTDACVLWWPIDRVSGDSVNDPSSYGGYNGKFPVYYCDNVDANFVVVEARKQVFLRSETQSGWTMLGWVVFGGLGLAAEGITGGVVGLTIAAIMEPGNSQTGVALNYCPVDSPAIPNGGYNITTTTSSGGNWFKKKKTVSYYCTPDTAPVVTVSGVQWYPYNGNMVKFKGSSEGFDETKKGVMFYDRTTGQLVKPEEYQIKCGRVHQAVNASGQNKSWTGRVYPASTFQVDQLGYKYGDDSAPFGSMVPPKPVHNPYEWDGSTLPGNNPVPLLPKTSNLARAGSPYSCFGSNCVNLGLCSISNEVCLYVPNNSPTSSSTNPIFSSINNCEMNDTEPCYTNWKQSLLPCPSDETCEVNRYNLETASRAASTSISRLFAKSYGTWDWSGTTGVCADNSGISCTNNTNQCPGGTCTARCKMYYQQTRIYNVGDPPPAYVPDVCDVGNPSSCSGIRFGGRTEAELNAANTCESLTSICGADGSLCVTNRCCDAPGSGSCSTGEEAECCAASSVLTAQQVHDACANFYTSNLSANICNESSELCATDADCRYDARCEWDTCTGGTQPGNACTAGQACAGSYCQLSNNNSGRYTPVSGQAWDVPKSVCATSPRPQAFAAGDYCAVPPLVFNVLVNNSSTTDVQIITSGLSKLTFNSDVEENQLPLVAYTVDWGDGDRSSINGMEMFDRPDPNNPHSLYHIYNYWDLKARASGGTAIDCSTASVCRVKPSVSIKDNWGWCNGDATRGTCNAFVPFPYWVIVREN